MASYFDEHDCEPLRDGEQPNHLLHLARLLLDTGLADEWQLEYSSLFGGQPAPPASKEVVESLPTKIVTPTQAASELKCPVCLGIHEEGEEIKQIPCGHTFHPKCILPWLEKTNSCPVCRHELPTDDQHYEDYKKRKVREKQREYDLEALHNSMFG